MTLHPYLTFGGDCRAAFTFYEELFDGTIEHMQTHGESPIAGKVPREWHDRILHTSLVIGDQRLMGSDAPPDRYRRPEGMSVTVNVDEPAEAELIFERLSDGGTIRMPMEETFWATRFGMVADRFRTPWIVNCPRPEWSPGQS